MASGAWNVREHPLPWGIPLLVTVLWHVAHTVLRSDPQNLLFVCYAANALLCAGVFLRSGLFVGVGFGWLAIAFPLWLYDAVRTSDWGASCTLFHVTGLVVGGAAFRTYRLPGCTWAVALALGVGLHALARVFTDEALNVNSAFRIYAGWEGVYPSYAVFYLATLLGFGLFFAALTRLNNRHFARRDGPGDA